MTTKNEDSIELVERLRAGDTAVTRGPFPALSRPPETDGRAADGMAAAARLDASDVLQEAFLDVASRLDEYLREPKLPPFLWLRLCVGEELVNLHRRHLGTKMRAAGARSR